MKATNRAMKRPRFSSTRAGFTLVELLIVIVISGTLMMMAIPSFTRVAASRNAQNARDAVVWMSSRARSRAIERGQTQLLEIDPATERVWIVRRNTGAALASDTLEKTNFSSTYNTQLSTTTNARVVLCFSPRGYAFSCSANSPAANLDVTFTHAGKTAVARVKPLGQIERL